MKGLLFRKSVAAHTTLAAAKSNVVKGLKHFKESEKGEGVIVFLIFVAILVIAVLGISGTIQDAFTSLATWFQTTVIDAIKNSPGTP